MKIDFNDRKLELLLTDRAHETKLPIAIIQSFRKKYVLLKSAPDEKTLINWRSFNYESLKGKRIGQKSIRLNKQWRLVFELNESEIPPRIIILSIEDYH